MFNKRSLTIVQQWKGSIWRHVESVVVKLGKHVTIAQQRKMSYCMWPYLRRSTLLQPRDLKAQALPDEAEPRPARVPPATNATRREPSPPRRTPPAAPLPPANTLLAATGSNIQSLAERVKGLTERMTQLDAEQRRLHSDTGKVVMGRSDFASSAPA